MKESAERRITALIFGGSFGIAAAALVVLALRQPLRSNIAASYLWIFFLVAGTAWIRRLAAGRRNALRIFLVIAVLNLIIVPPEAYLRLKGFRYESGIQFGYPRPSQFEVFEPHRELFWRFPPSRAGINQYGFAGPEVIRPKPQGTFRVLFIGNSCTYQGFPQIIEVMLKARHPLVECLNFATPGYSSYQGKVVLRLFIDELEPDLVVASFGWNDRWLAYGAVDEEKEIRPDGGRPALLVRLIYAKWRLLQFARKVFEPVFGRVEPLETPRVPLDHFERNVREIGRLCSARGIPAVFATEPCAFGARSVPPFVMQSGYARSTESFFELIAAYNEVVRTVSGERQDWHLIDLDLAVGGRDDIGELFTGDGFHFTERGLALIADIESRFIEARFLASSGEAAGRDESSTGSGK